MNAYLALMNLKKLIKENAFVDDARGCHDHHIVVCLRHLILPSLNSPTKRPENYMEMIRK